MFGKVPSVMDQQMNESFDKHPPVMRQSTFEGGAPNNGMNQTRIISEISNELKSNFKEEIGKLR